MKIKILILSVMLFSINVLNINAQQINNVNNNEYKELVRTGISRINESYNEKRASIVKSIFKGAEESYIIPEVEELENMRNEVVELIRELDSVVLIDANAKGLNDKLRNTLVYVYNVLNESIDHKKSVMLKDIGGFPKMVKVMTYEEFKLGNINKYFEEINEIIENIDKL